MNDLLSSVLQTIGWRIEGRVSVFVHGSRNPPDEEWDVYLDALRSIRNWTEMRVFVFSEGGGPSAAQRSRMFEVLHYDEGSAVRMAFLTAKPLARGIGVLLSWFNPGLKVLGPTAIAAACDHLGLNDDERSMVKVSLGVIQRRLDGSERGTG